MRPHSERFADFDAHQERVAQTAFAIQQMRDIGVPGEVIAKLLAMAPMGLYGRARELIFPKGN